MLYLGIDQHRKQLTVCVRNEAGDVTLRRQVSTQWDRVRAFLAEYRDLAQEQGGFVAILEICGFNDWLVKMLNEYGCREVVLMQPEKRSKKKTDRRDANDLGGGFVGQPPSIAGGQAGAGGASRCIRRRPRTPKHGS